MFGLRENRHQSTRSRAHLPAMLLLFFALYQSACSSKNPQLIYDHAKRTYRSGQIILAESEARKGYEQFHKSSPEWAWRFLILRANALHAQSKDEDALKILSSESTPLPVGELVIRKLRVQSVAHVATKQESAAEHELEQAERLCTEADPSACADILSARGQLEMSHSHFESGQQWFERELAAATSINDSFLQADAFLNLSWSADERTRFDEALDWAEAAHKIAVRDQYADVSQTALGNMGWAYYKLGDHEKALQMFAEAEDRAKQLGDLGDEISWLTAAAYVHMDAQNFAVAENSFRQALSLARRIRSRDDLVNSLIALAFVSEQTEKLDAARAYANEALSMAQADGNGRDATYPRLVLGRIAAGQHDSQTAETALQAVAQSNDSPVFLKWEAERSLARLYEDQSKLDQADQEYQTALSTFERARSELQHENSRLPFLTNASGMYDDYIHFLLARGKADQALQIANYSRARTLREGLGQLRKSESFHPDLLNATQIARTAGGTILFYWLGAKQSHLWAITSRKVALFALPAGPEIDAMVDRYRKTLLGPLDPLETSNSDGSALYRTLVEPAQSLIPSGSKVFVIPDGSLNTLNFETLLAPKPAPHYWIDDVTVADASSLLLLRPAKATNDRNLLLLGDPVVSNPDYPELLKASTEMEDIEKHFSSTSRRVFAREQATPGAYLEARPEQFSYVHFVAHGTASRISPLESAIVLSGTGTQGDSFKLYARDIVQRPLHAELVTISTCYGAGARAYSGEGLVGLSWAFLRAGAHNVIGALWEVSDASTPQLMGDLYAELEKGQPPQAALRKAKLALLHSESFRRPFYWAPFQLYTGS